MDKNTDKETNQRIQKWLFQLQKSGYRLTTPRRTVVRILADSEYTLTPSQIYTEAKKHNSNIGLVTIYRTLEKLEEMGLVQRVHEVDGCHSYIAAPIGHQHLLICQKCNRAEYFREEDLEPFIDKLGIERGYKIENHWLQLFGICPECRMKEESLYE